MLVNLISNLDCSWVLTLILACVVFVLVKEYVNWSNYPSGPKPWPLFGNALSLKTKNMNSNYLLHIWPKQFTKLFTCWMTKIPMVFVTSWDLIQDGLVTQRNNFSGRTEMISGSILQGKHDGIIFTDYGPAWETLRRIGFLAIRKYVDTEHLALVVSESVDKCIALMLSEGGAFDFSDFAYLVVYNILASTAFGTRYDMDDPEFVQMKNLNTKMMEEFNTLYSDIFPFLKVLFLRKENRARKMAEELREILKKKFEEHKLTYDPAICRDFMDAILEAREKAKLEEKQSVENMNDGNLINVVTNLFFAGTDTTRLTLLWIVLHVAHYPEVQEKMRKEISENVGNRIPIQSDKSTCHYTMAVINEVLRLKPAINLTLEHKATVHTKIGEMEVQKGTRFMFHIFGNHMNPEIWEEPDKFKPERFLEEDGSCTKKRLKGFMPFGLGRRGCVGEKLARADLFLMVARFLTKLKFTLQQTADFEPQNLVFTNCPKPFNIIVEKI